MLLKNKTDGKSLDDPSVTYMASCYIFCIMQDYYGATGVACYGPNGHGEWHAYKNVYVIIALPDDPP